MASFHTKTFKKYDDYITPKKAWGDIVEFIPKDKTIYMPFYCDGTCGKDMKSLVDNKIIHKKTDFFKTDFDEDYIVVDNPPYTLKKEILTELKKRDKPFMLIMPSSTLNTNYIRELFKNEIQIIIPRKRIQFIQMYKGKPVPNAKQRCNFDTFYFCYKMKLKRDIIFLE